MIAVTVTDEEGNIATDSVLVAGNLGIEKVETADSRGYYLNVTFTDSMDSLNVADIEIRDSSTKELFTVESATLSSDGYTASIAMKGAATEGQASSALEEGVSYTLKITQNGQTASSTFEVPKVRANAIIENYDKGNKQITVGPGWSARGTAIIDDVGTVTLSDAVAETVNYEDLLGRTVTVSLDSANHVTALEPLATQTVVYDFVKVKENGAGKDVVTGHDGKTTYDLEATETTNHSTQDAVVIDLGNKAAGAQLARTEITTTEQEWTYAKIVQNRDGYTQAIVYSDAATTVWKVDEMSGNALSCGGSTISLKNYTIVKDGLGITVDDIEEDDIVVVYATDKFAEVYSDSITGVPSAAYEDRFTLDGTSYKIANAVFAASDDGQKPVSASKMQDIVDSEASITMYFDRKGDFRFLVVNDEVASSTTTFIVNKTATGYAVGDKHYINFKAWDGTSSEAISITGENLSKINFTNGTEFKPTGAAPLLYNDDNSPTTAAADWGATSAGTYYFGSTGFAAGNEVDDIAAGTLIKVTYNDEGTATGLNLTAGKQPVDGGTNFALGNGAKGGITAGTTDVYDNSKTSVTIDNVTYTIAESTTVYKLERDGANRNATKTTYAEASGKIKAKVAATVTYHVDAGKKTVTAIVIEPDELTASTTTVRGVLTDKVVSSDGTKLKSVEFISADGKATYDGTAAIEGRKNDLAVGGVYDFELDASGDVAGFSAAVTAREDDAVVLTMDGAAKLTIVGPTVYTKASSETPIYVEHTGGGYKIIEPTDIDKDDLVDVYVIGGTAGAASTNYNVLIKDSDAAAAIAARAAEAAKIAALPGTVTTQTASASTASLSTFTVAGITAAGIDLTGATANATKGTVAGVGTVTLNGATSTVQTTTAHAGETATITITTALGNNIGIALTTESAKFASATFAKDGSTLTWKSTNVRNQYGDNYLLTAVSTATRVSASTDRVVNATMTVTGGAGNAQITFAETATTDALTVGAGPTTNLGSELKVTATFAAVAGGVAMVDTDITAVVVAPQ